MTEKYEQFKEKFEAAGDEANAISMSNYMRGQFLFYGIPSPERKAIYKEFIRDEKKTKNVDWEFCDQCFGDAHREFQYLACDYLSALNKYLTFEDIPKIKKYVLTKSWWDTIASLCKLAGSIGLKDRRVKDLMIAWSTEENFWIRRMAIEHQLGLKEKTDQVLLEQILINNFGSDEFFINKAIGWALRDYSKANADWVRSFVERHREQMAKLSIREAEKYL